MGSSDQHPEVTPILVVGLNRSGTKWLSNILCNHPLVAGVQSERARGILETNLFHRMREKFYLRAADDYIGFVELWRQSEFFRLINEQSDYLYTLTPRPQSFIWIFNHVMTRYAGRQNAVYWLQKCDPDRAIEVAAEIDRVRFIVIRRDMLDVAQSAHQMNKNRGVQHSVLRSIPGIARAEKLIRKIEAEYSAVTVNYDELREDPHRVVEDLCGRLELPFDPSLLEVPFAPNTSFRGERPAPFTPSYAFVSRMLGALCLRAPIWLLNKIPSVRHLKRPPLRFVAGTFGDLKERLADAKDYYK